MCNFFKPINFKVFRDTSNHGVESVKGRCYTKCLANMLLSGGVTAMENYIYTNFGRNMPNTVAVKDKFHCLCNPVFNWGFQWQLSVNLYS